MQVIFYNRDFSSTVQPLAEVTVVTYSRNMIGGPKNAQLKIEVTADKWEMMKLLRAPIEIYGDDGEKVWWGFINRITVPMGDTSSLGLGLNEMYNYVTVNYSEGDTAAASNSVSISEYGQKEARINAFEATESIAENQRDLYLDNHKGGVQEIELNGGVQEISVECYGWNSTLGWKYYANADTSNVANETQITTIVTDAGQFLQGSIITGASGLVSNEFRVGNYSALSYISKLMAAGTDNIQPYLSYVDDDRYLHVYERTAQPTQAEYLLRGDGKLITRLGKVIKDQECKVAVWVKPQSAPSTLDGFSTIGTFFIESAEYNVAQDKTTYSPAGAYEQIRLAKYIAAVTGGDGGGNNWTSIEGANIYNIINPSRYYETIELYQDSPQVLTAISDDMDWADTYSSRGNVIFWPYNADDRDIRLNKRGWYSFSWVIHGDDVSNDVVSCHMNLADKSSGYPLFPVDSTGRYGITQSYEVYLPFVNTVKMVMLEGTAGMNWRGNLQIVYKGA